MSERNVLQVVESPRRPEYRCGGCAYRVASGPPQACPMCRGRTWTTPRSHPDAPVTLTRLSRSVFLVTPPKRIDSGVSRAVTHAVLGLIADDADVVLDLTAVEDVADDAASLLLQLWAFARLSDGRLLAACPVNEAPGIALHDLDLDIAPDHGALARAFRRLRRRGVV